MALLSIAVLVQDPVALFEMGVLHEVFGVDRSAEGVPKFDFVMCTELPGQPLRSATFALNVDRGLDACESADLLAVPSGPMPGGSSLELQQVLTRAVDRGATVLGMCSGAFTLAESGLLDGRAAATHWRYAEAFERTFPQVQVDRDSLYRFEDSIITSAGTAAGVDACLQLVRREHGPAIANSIARRMVVPPHRQGGQRQYIDAPIPSHPSAHPLQALLAWMADNLSQEHSLDSLSEWANISTRTLSRLFRDELGTSPMTWLAHRRVARAQELLEGTDMSIDQVAAATGFGSDTLLRHHFRQQVGTTPTSYRAQFTTR